MASMMNLTLPSQPQPAAPFAPQQPQSGIAGGLPFGSMGQNASMPTDLASLGTHYASAYNSALAMNSSNYTNILAGYQQTLGQQTKAQDAIAGGYTDLYNNVLGQLGNQGQTQRNQINRDYASGLGRAGQQLIDRGLGNSTVQSSVNRGFEADRAMAGNALNEQVARQYADYASRLGTAGLDYRNQANMQNTGQSNRQLDWMNSVNSPYPDAGMYSQLAMQFGMADEAAKNRDAFNRGNGRISGPPMGGGMGGFYGNHFQKGFAGGEGGSGVQLGGGGGGGGGANGIDGRQAIGLGAYYTPSSPQMGGINDPFSYENYGQFLGGGGSVGGGLPNMEYQAALGGYGDQMSPAPAANNSYLNQYNLQQSMYGSAVPTYPGAGDEYGPY